MVAISSTPVSLNFCQERFEFEHDSMLTNRINDTIIFEYFILFVLYFFTKEPEASRDIGIVGLTSNVVTSSLPAGKSLSNDISTILSSSTFIPVVSRSKKTRGRVRFLGMGYLCMIIIYVF